MRQRGMLEAGLVGTGENPSLIRSSRSIRAGGDKISANLNDALPARCFLRDDVTKNAAFLLPVIVETSAQLIKDTAGKKVVAAS